MGRDAGNGDSGRRGDRRRDRRDDMKRGQSWTWARSKDRRSDSPQPRRHAAQSSQRKGGGSPHACKTGQRDRS
eukprot:1201032-Karenia_brevis.AAC.1